MFWRNRDTAPRIEASYKNLERAISWITNADNKALIGLAFQGAILAGLAALSSTLRTAMEHQRVWWFPVVELGILTAFVFTFGWSLWKFFRCLFPDVTPRDQAEATQSPLFFGTIAQMSLPLFRERMHSLDEQAIEEELIRQTHVVADIASRKFRDLKTAYLWLAPELLTVAVAVVLAEFGQK